MNCDIVFKVNSSKEVTMKVEASSLSPRLDEDIVNAIKLNEAETLLLVKTLKDRIYKGNIIHSISFDDIVKEGMIANCTSDVLKSEFPDFDWIDGPAVNVLLVNNLTVGGKPLKGRIISSNGEEIFVLQGSKAHVQNEAKKLANYLSVRNKLATGIINVGKDTDIYKHLLAIIEAAKTKKGFDVPGSVEELVLNFLDDDEPYRKLHYTIPSEDGKGIEVINAYVTLQKFSYSIKNDGNGRVLYKDNTVNTINMLWNHSQDKKGNVTKTISINLLYNILKALESETLEALGISSEKLFKAALNQPASQFQAFSTLFPNIPLENRQFLEFLTEQIFKREPEFRIRFKQIKGSNLIFTPTFLSLLDRYGISYSEICSMDLVNENYFGFKIYHLQKEGVDRWFISKEYLTEDSGRKPFNKREEAEAAAKQEALTTKVVDASFEAFKNRMVQKDEHGKIISYGDELDSFSIAAHQFLLEGTIISSLDIPLDTSIHPLESFWDWTYDNFIENINYWNISAESKANIAETINTPELIATFIYKINELAQSEGDIRKRDDALVETTLKQIKEATTKPLKSYYIAKRTPAKKGTYRYRVIPVPANVLTEYRKEDGKRKPIIHLLTAMRDKLQSQFNVPIEIITADEIALNGFSEYGVDPNTDRAFVLNGTIYINATIARTNDLFHEYTHILLGVLRANPELRANYELLMLIVLSNKECSELLKAYLELYKGRSQIDIAEEVFVEKFSQYIMGQVSPSLDNVFKSTEDKIEELSKGIFKLSIDDVKKVYSSDMSTIFLRFTADVASMLETANEDTFKETRTPRIISNWIARGVQDGKIKEECK